MLILILERDGFTLVKSLISSLSYIGISSCFTELDFRLSSCSGLGPPESQDSSSSRTLANFGAALLRLGWTRVCLTPPICLAYVVRKERVYSMSLMDYLSLYYRLFTAKAQRSFLRLSRPSTCCKNCFLSLAFLSVLQRRSLMERRACLDSLRWHRWHFLTFSLLASSLSHLRSPDTTIWINSE